MNCHIVLHEKMESKNIIKMGRINSAEDSPNHIPLKARPLLLSKYLDIVVDDVPQGGHVGLASSANQCFHEKGWLEWYPERGSNPHSLAGTGF